jgi:UDP-N-acetylmuramate--alanine ligase
MSTVRSADELGRVHFIGVGGIGMSGIARILLARGATVSGSDAKESTGVEALRVLGATIHIGHRPENVDNVDTVVISTAIRETNPELLEARRRGLRVIRRAAALAAVMAGYRGVAVTGTNGKTTTTSMLTVAAQHCGVDPSFAIGGDLGESGSNAHQGTGELFIAEADESDGSFLLLAPDVAIVTNVEVDHLDQHGTPEAYAKAFDDFLGRLQRPGVLVCCADDPGARRLAALAREQIGTVRTYGQADDADLRLTDVLVTPTETTYRAVLDGGTPVPVSVAATGLHMALNSAAALLTGLELGLPADKLIEGLAAYGGVRRRFELKGTVAGVRVYDDYAHHPSKVAAQLRAARVVAADGRLIVAFQPHLYSRTQAFAPEFGIALGLADEVVVMEVIGVREDPVPGVTGALVADAIPLPAERVHYEPSWSAAAPLLARLARPGDLVLTMGAGDVTLVGPEVLAELGAATP